MQLAPDGIVTYVYPLEGNEKAFGNIFESPERRAEAEYARDTGKMTLAGPYELSQGGMGPGPGIVDEISVPNGTWFFSMQPKTGWISWENTILELMIAIVIDTLLILLTYGGITILQQKRRMKELANTDSLTGLYNVRYFMSTIKRIIERQHPFGVLYLDLDKFKEVNDRYRHDIGDKLLIEVSSRIRSCLRKEDLLFRIGET